MDNNDPDPFWRGEAGKLGLKSLKVRFNPKTYRRLTLCYLF